MMRPGMRSTFGTAKRGLATVVSFWMAVMGCVMGCALPVTASSPAFIAGPSIWNNSHDESQPLPMADMENCHKSGGHTSLPPDSRKPASNSALSCCPFEVTVIQKQNATNLGFALSRGFVPSSSFLFALERSVGPAEFAPYLPYSGRDTLLKTQLLRI